MHAVKNEPPVHGWYHFRMSRSEDRAMKIIVNQQIHLSEILASDEAACVEHLQEEEIYDRTLRIPYSYTAADFQETHRGDSLSSLSIASSSTSPRVNPLNRYRITPLRSIRKMNGKPSTCQRELIRLALSDHDRQVMPWR